MKPISSLWIAGVVSAWTLAAGAQTQDPVNPPPATTTTTTTTTTTSSTPVTTLGGGGSPAETRIVNSFSTWAGSEDNARSLVTGLRQGSEITLTTPTASGPTGTGTAGTTFTPPTRPMGYGNIRIALSLARQQLAQSGITQPTPAQLEAALMGSTLTTSTGATTTTTTQYPGVLQMRADGMGWGQIANSMGVKLGQVMSGRAPLPPPAPATTTTTTTSGTATTGTGTSANTSTGTGSGITTATGASSSTTTTQNRGNSAWAHQTHQPGAGIVTAAGSSAVGVSAGARVQGGGTSAGIVTGAGGTAGSRSSAAVRAQGKGHVSP